VIGGELQVTYKIMYTAMVFIVEVGTFSFEIDACCKVTLVQCIVFETRLTYMQT
jgi:hypothetical protein